MRPAAHPIAPTAASREHGALAFLPFDNISPDQETDYFSNGLTEELILGREADADVARNELLERMPTYLLQNPDDARQRMLYATALAEVNRRDDAIRECSLAIEASPGDPLMLYNVVCVYSRLGEPQRAIDTMRQAIAAGYENFPWLHNDPDLDSLRDHPEFQALVAGH